MKRYAMIAVAVVAISISAIANHLAPGEWNIDKSAISLDGSSLTVNFTLDMDSLKVPSEEALIFTPVLYNGNDSLELHSVGVYGRRRYVHYERHGQGMITGTDEQVFKNADKPAQLHYKETIPYEEWMNGVRLKMRYADYGCCFTVLDEGERKLPAGYMKAPDTLRPSFLSATADSVVEKELEGSAYVQFIVDRTEIRFDFRDNARELGKITNSIDTVKSDPDFAIIEVWLKGFASPESPYAHNSDLAKGRTKAVSEYVQSLYNFAPGIITTDYEPEDWAGLRRYVEKSNLNNRESILEIIDTPMADLDEKEAMIRRLFPVDYAHLKEFAYPPLRHTEYRIKYRVRKFYNVDEIKRVMQTDPHKLSLNDFNLVAGTYEPGSPEFNEVYEVAVLMYPNNPVANLNAANSAMLAGNLTAAEKYLANAGDTAEANYARGLLKMAQGDLQAALPMVKEGAELGIAGAKETLDEINAYLSFSNQEK